MDKTLFDDLVQSLNEAKAITTGQTQASRRIVLQAEDVRQVREH